MRINNSGDYIYCRWSQKNTNRSEANIAQVSPVRWFQTGMSSIRTLLLDGESPKGCESCHVMEQHHKVSGRQRQLLKWGVTQDQFEETLLSSDWLPVLDHSYHDRGDTTQTPQDWQIDLDRKSTRLNSSHVSESRMPSSA